LLSFTLRKKKKEKKKGEVRPVDLPVLSCNKRRKGLDNKTEGRKGRTVILLIHGRKKEGEEGGNHPPFIPLQRGGKGEGGQPFFEIKRKKIGRGRRASSPFCHEEGGTP